ncbi:MAG: DUF3617 domain-containing protein [Candidatus Korobacteraceae bacterium]
MRNAIFYGAVLLWATILLAASNPQPLNVKTGLWQVVQTSTAAGTPPIPADLQAKLDQMTPEQRARMETMIKSRFGGTPTTRTYQKCITTKDLDTTPLLNQPDDKCTWTVLSSTGSEMEVRGTSCAAGRDQGMQTDIHIKVQALDSENVKASAEGTATGNGHTVNISNTFSGKWIGATCPAGTN